MIEYWMNQAAEKLPTWVEPEVYDINTLAGRREITQRISIGGASVQRKTADIAEDLFELRHPDQKNDHIARQRFVRPIIREGDRYGQWHYFAWSNSLVQYPDEQTHRELLTFRNRELITADELHKIGSVTVAHVGLSVGSHILEQTSHMAMGEKVILADPDIMSVPNLNRIHAGMPEVGMRKTDVAGIRLSELNPYVQQIHLPDGVTRQNAEVVAYHRPDLIFEEVDHLPTKILMRKIAYRVGAAVIMATDTGDRTMVDVERYDLGHVEPFLGRLSPRDLRLIEEKSPSPQETVQIIMKLIGLEHISVRLAISMGQIGITLGGIAQLGTTASVGGAYAAVAGREILLGRGPNSGRYKVTPQEVMHIRYI